ncbi:hypothetical protein F2Q65_06520 [Thiohalocapsa marina]|uniref:Ni,Fe-hydrogenase I large subunit n=1 Tax=Thiohalocapsa marina TaxID=424902 RepID=A0A5M8FQG7_9GAMM|nr:nickel-dependent hydrogenase large subunit [Thiohalocapsa marina]KAA6186016.1 hypothetical protein F2Q65_06520 [Thiohalocapsa marina]
MTDFGGKLDIALTRHRDRVWVAIRSSRPVTAAGVFADKTVLAATAQLPTLYSVCATAQAQAGALACEAAMGLAASAGAQRRRQWLLAAETAKEHFWRLLLDWPAALDLGADAASMALVMRAYRSLRGALTAEGDPFRPGTDDRPGSLEAGQASAQAENASAALAALASGRIFGMDARRWLERTDSAAGLMAWSGVTNTGAAVLVRTLLKRGLAGLGRNGIGVLPALSAEALSVPLSAADAAAFVAAPCWPPTADGPALETTPFARCRKQPLVAELTTRYGNGLLPRLAALLVELAEVATTLANSGPIPGWLETSAGAASAAETDSGRTAVGADAGVGPISDASSDMSSGLSAGVGVVQAARGLLVHRVAIEEAQVRSWRILAPTEWNFHPRGVVAAGLAALDPEDPALRLQATLYCIAVDPCVDFTLSVS